MNTDPAVVDWQPLHDCRANDDYTSRLTGCWPCRRCLREFRHPLPRAAHERACTGRMTAGVNGGSPLFRDGTGVVPDDPKALAPPALAP